MQKPDSDLTLLHTPDAKSDATWLLNFNIINSSNRLVYSMMEVMYRLCEPSLSIVRKYIPNFGAADLSPIVVYLGLWFIKSLLIEYWPR